MRARKTRKEEEEERVEKKKHISKGAGWGQGVLSSQEILTNFSKGEKKRVEMHEWVQLMKEICSPKYIQPLLQRLPAGF